MLISALKLLSPNLLAASVKPFNKVLKTSVLNLPFLSFFLSQMNGFMHILHVHIIVNFRLVRFYAIPECIFSFVCPGEALFMNDAPALPGELTGYIIQSTVGRATITSIDTSQALVR